MNAPGLPAERKCDGIFTSSRASVSIKAFASRIAWRVPAIWPRDLGVLASRNASALVLRTEKVFGAVTAATLVAAAEPASAAGAGGIFTHHPPPPPCGPQKP